MNIRFTRRSHQSLVTGTEQNVTSKTRKKELETTSADSSRELCCKGKQTWSAADRKMGETFF